MLTWLLSHSSDRYALEDTSCMNRFCLNGLRPWTMNVSQGADAGGPLQAKYERPLRCPMQALKCCCYQEVMSLDASGAPNGSVVESFWICNPMFNVQAPDGTVEYRYHCIFSEILIGKSPQ